MKIMIVNPNSDSEMTRIIQKTADHFAERKFEVVCVATPGAPEFIETREDEVKAAPGMIKLVRDNAGDYDAFIVACHCDPNLEVLKEIIDKPVIGIGEASMRIASMLGRRFSIIQTTEESIPLKEALVEKYRLRENLASVRAPQNIPRESSDEEKYLSAARIAVTEDKADVVVLGCAGLTGMDKRLQKELGIPVLDGVVCALILACSLLMPPSFYIFLST